MTDTAPQSEEQRVESIDTRFQRVEDEQREQRGILETIRDSLTGGHAETENSAPVTRGDDPLRGPDPGAMAEQMRQAVRDVNAEAAQQAAEQAHAADHARMRPAPETTPREVMVKGKARLQKVLFGGDR